MKHSGGGGAGGGKGKEKERKRMLRLLYFDVRACTCAVP